MVGAGWYSTHICVVRWGGVIMVLAVGCHYKSGGGGSIIAALI